MIEDEQKLAVSLKKLLETEGYAVDFSFDGESGYQMACDSEYDLIILDVGIPKIDGFTVAKKLREDGNNSPILMLTARDTIQDKIQGLDNGADDYLVKPFEFSELLARIRALLRRGSEKVDLIYQIESLTLNPNTHIVQRLGKEIKLSAKEYSLLEYLMRHPKQIISRSQILEHVWDIDTDPFSNIVEVYIGYLRVKIDKAYPKEKPLIFTVKGIGYRIGQ